jgi:putative SOS response-associated peptidase YedK
LVALAERVAAGVAHEGRPAALGRGPVRAFFTHTRTTTLPSAESVTTSNAYQGAFKRRRAILPADGFYEWKKLPGGKREQPVLPRSP